MVVFYRTRDTFSGILAQQRRAAAAIEWSVQPRPTESHVPRWYLVPLRVLLIGFFVALMSFAVSLFVGIWIIVIRARLQGFHPNMTLAYRHVALPVAAAAAVVAVIVAAVVELRHYRQAKALAEIANASR